MAADIDQLDAIIDKFLDYARPDHVDFKPVLLRDVIDACTYAVQDHETCTSTSTCPRPARDGRRGRTDRVISNLVENARRYGKTPETGIAVVDIAAQAHNDWVLIKVRDHGAGVAPEALSNLTKPFFRGDAARTSAAGAGLGLSIVDKNIERMGGTFALASTTAGGLAAHIKIKSPGCRRCRTGPSEPRRRAARVVAPTGCSSTTARASIARPSPTGPSFSAVLAFTLTCPASRPSACAMRARMAAMCGASFGACAITVLSTLPICQPAARTRARRLGQQHASNRRPGTCDRCRGSGGRCRPARPRRAAHR